MEPSVADQLKLAATYLANGKIVVPDKICREILDTDPGNAVALNILGIVAVHIGRHSEAAELFRSALRVNPNFGPAERNLHQLDATPGREVPPHTVDGRRFLLIKAWGFGFWADVTQVLGALLLADLTGRIPVTHWGKNSLFTNGSEHDAFATYFEPVSPYTVDSLEVMTGADFFPAKWSRANLRQDDNGKWTGLYARLGAIDYLSRPEAIAVADFYTGVIDLMPWIPKSDRLAGKTIDEVYRDLAQRYLRPRPQIMQAVDEFQRSRFDDATIAVHYRGSDKKNEMRDFDDVNARYFDVLDRFDPKSRIFLLTDDARAAAAYRARFGERIILSDCLRTDNDVGIHIRPTADRTRLGIEVMIDTYLAMRCSAFVGNGKSNVSAVVAALKAWPAGRCTLLVPSFLSTRNIFVHLVAV